MPELPEVETIVRSLRNIVNPSNEDFDSLATRPGILARVVASVSILWERSLAHPTVQEFKNTLPGQKVQSVGRRGKYLVIQFEHQVMLIHLRMSGDIRVEKTSINAPQKHDRMVLRFTDGWQMVFNDPRKFGRIWLVDQIEEITSNLGVEPLSDELTGEGFIQKLHATSRRIKQLLLDQSIVAGLGNIYTDEALFLASIHPLTSAREITALQAESLLRSIHYVLEEGIRRNGASIDWVYRGGDFQNHFNVYQRTGEPCKVCGTKIERIVVGQRGTHYCPRCQPYSVTYAGDPIIK
jgi:formamidopyrimidine-DNA glycosylase